MRTQVKKRGNSLVIVLAKEFIKFYKLKEGDWVDLSDILKIEEKNG